VSEQEKIERLEEALLSFIERAAKAPLSDEETSTIPAAAMALITVLREPQTSAEAPNYIPSRASDETAV